MFARSGNRLIAVIWEGADLAVEFATLGEYRLPAGRAGRPEASAPECGERPGRRPAARLRPPHRRATVCVQALD